jgi:hypothetical protein
MIALRRRTAMVKDAGSEVDDQGETDRWLKSAAFIATLFVAMLASILFFGNKLHSHDSVTDVSASKQQDDAPAYQELLKTIDLDKLPVQQVDDPV